MIITIYITAAKLNWQHEAELSHDVCSLMKNELCENAGVSNDFN